MNLALFDFDGTITECDTFTPFIKKAIPRSRMIVGRLLLMPSILLSLSYWYFISFFNPSANRLYWLKRVF